MPPPRLGSSPEGRLPVVSFRAAESPSSQQAVRSAVTEQTRRAGGPSGQGSSDKSGASDKGPSGQARGKGSNGKSGAAGNGLSGKGSTGKASRKGSTGKKKLVSPRRTKGIASKLSRRHAKTEAVAAGRSPRSSKVVLRRVRPASVLKVSVLFYLSLALTLFVAGVLLWLGANAVGLIDNLEGFMDEVGFTDFRLQPGPLLAASLAGSIILVIAGSLANVLMAVLYNLIGDVVGGVRIVLTEDTERSEK